MPNPTGPISKNFRWEEFTCRCGCEMPNQVQINIQVLVSVLLQPIRKQLGRAIHIGSGYRCKKHNKAIGGAKYSQHKEGTAADIVVRGMEPACVYSLLDEHLSNHYKSSGLGKYPSFTHVDLRKSTSHARW